MPVTPITPAQIDEVGKGACLTGYAEYTPVTVKSHTGASSTTTEPSPSAEPLRVSSADAASVSSRGASAAGLRALADEISARMDMSDRAEQLIDRLRRDYAYTVRGPAVAIWLRKALSEIAAEAIELYADDEEALEFTAANPSGEFEEIVASVMDRAGKDPAQELLRKTVAKRLAEHTDCNLDEALSNAQPADLAGHRSDRLLEAEERAREYHREVDDGSVWDFMTDEVRDCYRQAAERLHAKWTAAANPSGGWRPIETAPKVDEQEILVWDDRVVGGFPQVVWWNDDPSDPNFRWDTSDGPTFHVDAFTHWMPLPPPPGALGTEARSAETETGSVEDEGPACKATPEATPSIPPPPSPRKGQEENPCPMTGEEAKAVLATLAKYGLTRDWIDWWRRRAEHMNGDDKAKRIARANLVELALSTIRASEEDR